MSLEREIHKHAATVKTESYSMSIGELTSMYRDEELDLHPDFQRFFRWTPEQKSRFIESLLLGIPVPPVFVSERGDSKWDVIDGLQRLSTIFELMGELKDENNNTISPLKLTRAHYLPSLKDMTWESLPESIKIRVKRARLDVNIVKSTSDEEVKFEIFQRLNTGGAHATEQEVRNCVLIMADKTFFEWLKELASYEAFRDCLYLTDRALEEAFDMELVTRFLVFSALAIEELEYIDELGTFLTHKAVEMAKDSSFSRKSITRVFKKTFDILSEALAENSFRRYDKKKQKYSGAMLASLFEVVGTGMGYVLLQGKKVLERDNLKTQHKNIWIELGKKKFLGSGVRASTRIPKTVEYGRNLFMR